MFDLLGSQMPLPLKFFIAFATVLVLIGATAWLVRRFGANRLGGSNARGRQPRLAVIDVTNVDQRRRLVLIRRDNVEHLLMIGGPSDVVVEPNIVRAAAGREAVRSEPGLRAQSANDGGWPLQPINEPPTPTVSQPPVATPSPRTYRASATEEPWLAPEPGARPRPADNSSLSGLAAELSSRLQSPPEPALPPRQEPRHDPPVRASAPPPAPAMSAEPPSGSSQPDHNLAEMAQQLEAALRRSPMPEGRPPVTDPLAAAASMTAPEPRSPARDFKSRMEPKFDSSADKPSAAPRTDFRPEPRLDAKPAQPVPGKSAYDNLEEEMASLLGRPPGKT